MITGGRMTGAIVAVLAIAGALIAGSAGAQVYEIQPDGSVITFGGPTRFTFTGAQPLPAEEPPPGGALPGSEGHAAHHRRAAGRAMARAWTAPPPGVAQVIHEAAARHQVDERLVTAVAAQESGFNPAAVSPKGARGVMQLMPGTARALGVDAADPARNIDGGADYLSRMLRLFNGDKTLALAAYNAGPEAVARYGGVPPYAETSGYVRSVLGRMNAAAPPAPGAAGETKLP
jgi:soluble lytic murein transglycosylase-like protein